MAARSFTPEQRARQAELIRRWRPWASSTGPKTDTGKSRASRNADKGGQRPRLRLELKELHDLLKKQASLLDDVRSEWI